MIHGRARPIARDLSGSHGVAGVGFRGSAEVFLFEFGRRSHERQSPIAATRVVRIVAQIQVLTGRTDDDELAADVVVAPDDRRKHERASDDERDRSAQAPAVRAPCEHRVPAAAPAG